VILERSLTAATQHRRTAERPAAAPCILSYFGTRATAFEAALLIKPPALPGVSDFLRKHKWQLLANGRAAGC
jgi:hypothetical protein